MKKRLTLAIAAAWALSLCAQEQSYYVCCADGHLQTLATNQTENFTFNEQGDRIIFSLNDGTAASFAVGAIDSIAFAPVAGRTPWEWSPRITVDIDPTEQQSYSEVAETITTVETPDNDYGDFIENYTVNNTITITYNGGSATYSPTVSNVKVAVEGANVTVTSAKKKMKYILKGSSDNGSFKLYSDYKYALELNNLTLTNPTGPAINIQSGKTAYMLLPDATTTTLCDGATYADAPVTGGVAESQKGTLFSEGQLVFSGNGTLNVTSLYGHAICSDDYIRVRGGNFNLTAAKDGIHTNDHYTQYKGTIRLTAGDDGVDCGKGHIAIYGGQLFVEAVDEGITASYDEGTDPTIVPYINMQGGFVKVTTSDYKGMGLKSTGSITLSGGHRQITVNGPGSKGINADGDVTLAGGNTTIVSRGDIYGRGTLDATAAGGVKCGGNFTLAGGALAVENSGAGAKGINADGTLAVSGGSVAILSTGGNGSDDSGTIHCRALVGAQGVNVSGGIVRASSTDNALYTATGSLVLGAGDLQLYSGNKAVNSAGGITQTGGRLITGKNEQ